MAQSAPLYPSFNEYTRSQSGPAGLSLPAGILAVYPAVIDHEQKQGRDCSGGFYFGGLFSSLARGEKPRDVDIVVHAPDMVALARKLAAVKETKPASYSEMRELDEDRAYYEGKITALGSTLELNPESLKFTDSDELCGGCLQATGHIYHDGAMILVDVSFTEKPVDPLTWLTRMTDAPIRSIGFDPDKAEFIHHRDFESHVNDWVYKPFPEKRLTAERLGKAEQKGMTVIAPANP